MQAKNHYMSYCLLLLLLPGVCYTGQQNPFEKTFEYFQKPMRPLEPQVMDEVLEYAPDEIKNEQNLYCVLVHRIYEITY